MEHLAQRFAEVPGVVAVALGGSRASGRARLDSDWDFGLYYRGTIDVADIRALGFEGEVYGPGEWGIVPNGGAWLVIDDARVDLIYRDLDVVEEWARDAEHGRFQVLREVGYVAGVATYTYAAELALNKHLVGALPRPQFPDLLRQAAPARWRHLATGTLKFAESHARRGDAAACAGSLGIAVLSVAHARLCERGEWYLNDKDLVARAELASVQGEFRALADDLEGAVERVRALLDES